MASDWERYLEQQDHKYKLVRKVFYWSIFCILLVAIIIKSVDLISESKPEYNYSENTSYSDTSDDAIHIISDGTSSDAIFLTANSGGISISEPNVTIYFEEE